MSLLLWPASVTLMGEEVQALLLVLEFVEEWGQGDEMIAVLERLEPFRVKLEQLLTRESPPWT